MYPSTEARGFGFDVLSGIEKGFGEGEKTKGKSA
jgi:hypothetical protein